MKILFVSLYILITIAFLVAGVLVDGIFMIPGGALCLGFMAMCDNGVI